MNSISNSDFDEKEVLNKLKKYLPSQSPLKDFIHHNTLHAFQEHTFFEALKLVNETFGYKTILSLEEFRELYGRGEISESVLYKIAAEKKGTTAAEYWIRQLKEYSASKKQQPILGRLRKRWKEYYGVDLEINVQGQLFRLLNSYLDQGIAIWKFPGQEYSFLDALRRLEATSYTHLFNTPRAASLFKDPATTLEDVLSLLVKDRSLYEQYLFDQQFSHPGWSGMVVSIEKKPSALIHSRNIRLEEVIFIECLLELDILDGRLKGNWNPLSLKEGESITPLFVKGEQTIEDELLEMFQEAYEWTFYEKVLAGIQSKPSENKKGKIDFQSFFCMDDRECSIRRNLELVNQHIETFGTPGHYNLDICFQPEDAELYTKVCPAPVQPRFLIKESSRNTLSKKDVHFNRHSHGLLNGWVYTHTVGLWSGLKLMLNVFHPVENASSVSSSRHMMPDSVLSVLNENPELIVDGLQVGLQIPEMIERVEGVLRSTGLTTHFAPIVYIIGHGSSSSNNTHYAGYDCGACSGRPGSVNARVFSIIANMPEVRNGLRWKGIYIPDNTWFVGGLHDTARDEISFFDEQLLDNEHAALHLKNKKDFEKALDMTAKERSRRFMSVNSQRSADKVHKDVRKRTVSLFEPRPELNHSNNTLCIIGRRAMTESVFLDRRSFLNSYDYRTDPSGDLLLGIINAAAGVVGGINLEYYFSRIDNHNLGAGTKLPHNVMGLIGVANGIEGDLRTGLPSQMIEVHEPLRMLVIIEQTPELTLATFKRNPSTYQWFENEWLNLVVKNPEDGKLYRFKQGHFMLYDLQENSIKKITDLESEIESTHENLPIYHLSV